MNQDKVEVKMDVDVFISTLKSHPDYAETFSGSENWDDAKKKDVVQGLIDKEMNSAQSQDQSKPKSAKPK